MFGKSKSAKSNSKGTGPELSELITLVTKIAERLFFLEKKTDLVIRQTSARPFERREHPKPAPQSAPSQPFRQPGSPERPNEINPAQGRPHERGRGRREKVLYKAVCADCQKDCEIPFQPTGERPVYCKECFSKRKAGGPVKTDNGNGQAPNFPEAPGPVNTSQRQVSVTKKGVGKVTVSEIVRSSARDISQKGKTPAPEKKLKKS